MNKIKILLTVVVLIFSTATGFFIGYSYAKPKPIKRGIQTTQISGEKIRNLNFRNQGDSISFTTVADGKGVAQTTIEKTVIPEAKYWIKKTNCFQISYYSDYRIGTAYLKRFNSYSIGAGVVFPIKELKTEKFSLFISAQIWF